MRYDDDVLVSLLTEILQNISHALGSLSCAFDTVLWIVPFCWQGFEDRRLELRELDSERLAADAFVAFCVVGFAEIGANF